MTITYQFAARRPGNAKLSDREVKAVKVYLQRGTPRARIADLFDVPIGTINEIARGRRWGHVTVDGDETV